MVVVVGCGRHCGYSSVSATDTHWSEHVRREDYHASLRRSAHAFSHPFDEADERLDARETDGEPFGDIVAALDGEESLCLVNRFEPEPLYDVSETRGFAYGTANPADDEWYVEITPA
ncbi:DUF2249 domain-containing protein [Halorubrum ejinorense]|uniref:DUF2249 domain-containing protein n=1 Tax=Halorubrum ejinorense TaxID=425309 RepID=UPI003526ED24